jgi:hypothetical protein
VNAALAAATLVLLPALGLARPLQLPALALPLLVLHALPAAPARRVRVLPGDWTPMTGGEP